MGPVKRENRAWKTGFREKRKPAWGTVGWTTHPLSSVQEKEIKRGKLRGPKGELAGSGGNFEGDKEKRNIITRGGRKGVLQIVLSSRPLLASKN